MPPIKKPARAPKSPLPPASEAVRGEWLRRVQAEYRSAAVTQQLTLWLIQMGASPDLISAGLRIVRDELT
ncbi:MAG: ferritin-like domain-containing protein, partial [Minicystis sp.]